ncbi:MAG: 50S ribosomal protein L25/general stress protein Ctc [Mariprofundaceae bacterium]|nr:50S ribosomal protein L25/general stress protein Ctc [Mariprofundaceae bacterium]
MTDLIVEAELRETTGKGDARRMRRAGLLPGIIYGGGKPDLAITINANTIGKLLNEEAFYTSMLEVKVKGKRGKNTVLLKDVQWEPILDTAMHLDFMRVSSADSVTVEVPVIAINFEKCPGDVAGGLLDVIRHVLEITCRADSIPDSIEVDCANMDIGDTVHIEDLTLPEGAEVIHDVNFTVLNVSAKKIIVETETEEEGTTDDTTSDADADESASEA